MPLTRPRRIAVAVAAFAAVAAAASGVTYASTTVPSAVKACENRYGTLRLLSATGTCSRGYTKVSIGRVGPRGPQGVRGLTGPKGDQGIQGIQGVKGDKGDKGDQGDQGDKGDQGIQGVKGDKGDTGPQGPGAISVVAAATSGSDFHDKALPGFGITARAVCGPNSQSSVYLMDSAASTNFDVRGTAVRSATGSGQIVWSNGLSQNTAIPSGTSLQSYTQTATFQGAAFEVVNYSGDLSADLVVTRDGHTFVLHMYTIQSSTSCLVQAQVTPAS